MDELRLGLYAHIKPPMAFDLEGFYGKNSKTEINITIDIKEEVFNSLANRDLDLDYDIRNEDALESLRDKYDEDDIVDAIEDLLTKDSIESFELMKDREYDYYGNEGDGYDVNVTVVFDKEQVIEKLEEHKKTMETFRKEIGQTKEKGEER